MIALSIEWSAWLIFFKQMYPISQQLRRTSRQQEFLLDEIAWWVRGRLG
jgi:hypothetical protein